MKQYRTIVRADRTKVVSVHENKLCQMIHDAKRICEHQKPDDAECVVAWDSVDEFHRALIRKDEQEKQDALEKLCELEPDIDECRMYDI